MVPYSTIMLTVLFGLLALWPPSPVVGGSCLKSLQVYNSTATSITVQWNYFCTQSVNHVLYKVYYEHVEWKACSTNRHDSSRGKGRGNREVYDITSVTLTNLHPYSVYKLTVKALPEYNTIPAGRPPIPDEEDKIAETVQGVPEVRPVPSSIPISVESDNIRFYWRPPPATECEKFNSKLDGFSYILKGIDVWNVGESHEGTTADTSMLFRGLKPYSDYILFVYSANEEGTYNDNFPFKIPAETAASEVAEVPRNLKAYSQVDGETYQHHVTWLPPYPPTGILGHYNLRWKRPDTQVWLGTVDVDPNLSGDLCANVSSTTSGSKYEQPLCYSMTPSDYDSVTSKMANLTFQVSAFNAKSSVRSRWSAEVNSEVLDDAVDPSPNMIAVIVIASVVSVLLLILLVTFIACQCNKKKRYKNVPNYVPSNNVELRQLPPPAWTPPSPNTTNRQSSLTSAKYQHLLLPVDSQGSRRSIQELPLPPLPPYKTEPLYEELSPETLLSRKEPTDVIEVTFNVNEMNRSKSSSVNDQEDDGDFLKPTNEDSDDGYLTPRMSKSLNNDEDEDEYLKPTFNQFERINSRDLSPPTEMPPPIPMESYATPTINKANA